MRSNGEKRGKKKKKIGNMRPETVSKNKTSDSEILYRVFLIIWICRTFNAKNNFSCLKIFE